MAHLAISTDLLIGRHHMTTSIDLLVESNHALIIEVGVLVGHLSRNQDIISDHLALSDPIIRILH